MICMPTGSPSTVPTGMDTAGIAGQVGRHGEGTVVAESALEAEFGDQVAVADGGGHGPGGVEGHVGVGGGEDEVHLGEGLGHDLVQGHPEHLVGPGQLEVEAAEGDVHGELDLGGEELLTGGVAVAQVPDQGDQVAHGPFESGLGQLEGQIHPLRDRHRR